MWCMAGGNCFVLWPQIDILYPVQVLLVASRCFLVMGSRHLSGSAFAATAANGDRHRGLITDQRMDPSRLNIFANQASPHKYHSPALIGYPPSTWVMNEDIQKSFTSSCIVGVLVTHYCWTAATNSTHFDRVRQGFVWQSNDVCGSSVDLMDGWRWMD